jgi:glutamine amidotransferase
MIKIIDYGMGNCGSIKNMLRFLGTDSEIIDNPQDLIDANAIILPGVGSFDHGVRCLQPFMKDLKRKVLIESVPLLGICLGMQLLFDKSDEGILPGLGWITGNVQRFDFSNIESGQDKFVIPHMGWNEVVPLHHKVFFSQSDVDVREYFYFAHSYHAVGVSKEHIFAKCEYGSDFTCAVGKDNLVGVQFHPEKSHKYGKHFFASFLQKYIC